MAALDMWQRLWRFVVVSIAELRAQAQSIADDSAALDTDLDAYSDHLVVPLPSSWYQVGDTPPAPSGTVNIVNLTSAWYDVWGIPAGDSGPPDPPPPSSFDFDDGQPGIPGDAKARAGWFWDWDTSYFEPAHAPLGANAQRVVYCSANGTGDGLSSGAPTNLPDYVANIQAPGDQVRMSAETHHIGSGTLLTVQGTAAKPIRFVRDNPAAAWTVTNDGANSTFGFTDSYYLGIHGADIDGQDTNVWGLSFGRRFGGDSTPIRCHHVDVWHCDVHNSGQTVATFEGSGTGSARGHDVHYFGTELRDSGGDPAKTFNELLYLGSGSDSDDWVDNAVIEACYLHDSRSGEAIDIKNEATGVGIHSCLLHTIRPDSQSAIVAFDAINVDISYLVTYDILVEPGGSEAAGLWTSSVTVDRWIAWNIGATLMVSSRKNRGTGGVQLRRVTAWDLLNEDDFGSGTLHYESSLYDEGYSPTVDIDGTVISPDGDQGSYQATAGQFDGPIDGTADSGAGAGSGFSGAFPAGVGALS